MSFREALGDSPAPLPASAERERVSAVGPARVFVRAALERFAQKSRALRESAPRGSPMPKEHAESWERLLAAIDDFARRRPAEGELAFASDRLEAELSADAQTFGDFPPLLAEAALERVGRLALRLAQLRRARAPKRPALSWPLLPVRITSLFGRRVDPLSGAYRLHFGLDLAAEPGQLITAAADGTVAFAGWNGAHGRQVAISHPGGLMSRYSHLSQLLVVTGFSVEQGAPVGLAGSSGKSTGVHLHFELLKDGAPVDPLDELEPPDEDDRQVAVR